MLVDRASGNPRSAAAIAVSAILLVCTITLVVDDSTSEMERVLLANVEQGSEGFHNNLIERSCFQRVCTGEGCSVSAMECKPMPASWAALPQLGHMEETEAGISMVPPPEDTFSQMPVGKLANGGHASSKQSKKLQKETTKYQASNKKDYAPAHQKKEGSAHQKKEGSDTIGGKGAQHCFERQCVSNGGSMDCRSVQVSCGKLQKMTRGGFGFPFGNPSGGSSSGSHPMLPIAKVLGRILKKLKAHGVKVHVVRIVPKPEHQSPAAAKAAQQVRKAMVKDIKKVLEKAHSKDAKTAEEKEEKDRSSAVAKSQKAGEAEGEALKKEFPKNVKIKKSKNGFKMSINTKGKDGGAIMKKLAKAMMGGGF